MNEPIKFKPYKAPRFSISPALKTAVIGAAAITAGVAIAGTAIGLCANLIINHGWVGVGITLASLAVALCGFLYWVMRGFS